MSDERIILSDALPDDFGATWTAYYPGDGGAELDGYYSIENLRLLIAILEKGKEPK